MRRPSSLRLSAGELSDLNRVLWNTQSYRGLNHCRRARLPELRRMVAEKGVAFAEAATTLRHRWLDE